MNDRRDAEGPRGGGPMAGSDDAGTPSVYPTISYRTPPEHIPTRSIIAELIHHIGDAETWPGEIGAYARQRAAALRAELARREVRP